MKFFIASIWRILGLCAPVRSGDCIRGAGRILVLCLLGISCCACSRGPSESQVYAAIANQAAIQDKDAMGFARTSLLRVCVNEVEPLPQGIYEVRVTTTVDRLVAGHNTKETKDMTLQLHKVGGAWAVMR